jgi:outer membrane protein assembly factor BamB
MRRASAIRFLSTCRFSHRLAAAFWEKTVQIWDLDLREQVGQFDTGRGDGSNRLHLDPKGERGVVAAWQAGAKGGVACYEIPTGKLVWHRGDLRHSQGISFSTDGQSVWFEPNEGRVERLDALSGNTIEYLSGVRHIHVNHHSSEIFIERRSGGYVLRGVKDFDIPKITFAILDVAFGLESLCLTESVGPVRCLDFRSGVELWRYDSPKDNHVLRLWYSESDGHYYGVQWQYQTGGPRRLLRFDARSGQAKEIFQFDSWEEEVCTGLDCLVASSGEILSLADGKSLGRLDFPQRDYSD